MWSQNEFGYYLIPILAEKKQKIVEIAILVYFDGFSAKMWVKYYQNTILRSDLETFHQDKSCKPPM